MEDIMDDLRLPAGWTSYAHRGWPLMDFIGGRERSDDVADVVTFSSGHIHPRRFSLDVKAVVAKTKAADEHSISATLFFQMSQETKDISLASVLSIDTDVDTVMDHLRSHRPITWWKHKAKMQLADYESRDEPRDIYSVLGPAYEPDLDKAEDQYKSWVASIPTSRNYTRVTEARLDEVARLYLEAQERGERPTKFVFENLKSRRPDGIGSYSSAAQLVAMARKKGKLPPFKR